MSLKPLYTMAVVLHTHYGLGVRMKHPEKSRLPLRERRPFTGEDGEPIVVPLMDERPFSEIL